MVLPYRLISTCILFAVLLLYKLSLFLFQLSIAITPRLFITKVHSFVTIVFAQRVTYICYRTPPEEVGHAHSPMTY